jgi:hypothetical protein
LDSQLGPISYHALIEGKWGLIITFHRSFDPVATTVRTFPSSLLEPSDLSLGDWNVMQINRRVRVQEYCCDHIGN